VEVDRLVIVTIREALDVTQSAHRQEPAAHLRVTQGEADRVIASEARSGHDQKRIGVLLARKGRHLVKDVAIVSVVSSGAFGRVMIRRVPALRVDVVYAVELNAAGSEAIGERTNQSAILPLMKPTERRGKSEHAGAGLTEDQ